MLSHAYHLNQKHQIMITIRMIRMTITSTITIMITHGQELENTRALSQAFTTVLAAARDLGSLLLTRWHLRDIKVRDGGSDGTSRDGDLHPAEPHGSLCGQRWNRDGIAKSTSSENFWETSIFGCKDNGFCGFSTKPIHFSPASGNMLPASCFGGGDLKAQFKGRGA